MINTPIESLIRLSKNEYWLTRYEIAKHINTPLSILIELSKDKDENVRDAAKRNRIRRIGLLK